MYLYDYMVAYFNHEWLLQLMRRGREKVEEEKNKCS